MKTVPRVILIAAFLVFSVVAVLPVAAGHSPSPAVFQSGIETPTLPPPATSTPVPPATETPAPAATNTPVPAATNTPVPTATYMPSPPFPPPPHVPPPHVPPAYPPAPPQSAYSIIAYWTVQPGQTLYCIGRYYQVSPWAIASVNRIPWPYFIYTGQILAIPNAPWYNIPPGPVCYPGASNVTPTPSPGGTPTPTPPPSVCRYHHTVQWGQTLSRIAWYYRTTIQAIMYANPGITNPNLIYAGSVLCIP